jgi:hypothetical protein
MTGTYADRDDEQVAFVRPHDLRTGEELGTITTTGTNSRGTWTWTYEMPLGDTDHLVAIDPIDGSGNNATIFRVRATDTPPSPTAVPSSTPPPNGGGTGPAADVTAPTIGGLSARRLKNRRERFRVAVSEPARVTITVRRTRPRLRRPVGRVSRQTVAGPARLTLRKRLRAGRYRATAIATDAAGNRSRPVSVRFRATRVNRAFGLEPAPRSRGDR